MKGSLLPPLPAGFLQGYDIIMHIKVSPCSAEGLAGSLHNSPYPSQGLARDIQGPERKIIREGGVAGSPCVSRVYLELRGGPLSLTWLMTHLLEKWFVYSSPEPQETESTFLQVTG